MLGFDVVRARIDEGVEKLAALVEGIEESDWDRRTRCPGWRVRDAAWHIGWGSGPGEVVEAARRNLDPPDYATSRMGPTPQDPAEIVKATRNKLTVTRADLDGLTDDDASMAVRYGRNAAPTSLHEFLWSRLVEVAVHTDDIATALGVDQELPGDFARELVERRARAAVSIAPRDGLQPTSPRGYRFASGDLECGFFFGDGEWHEGIGDVPTCTFDADPTTLARLVMGRIPVTPFDATWGRPWDDRLRLAGAVAVAAPADVKRWCYGTW